MLRKGEGRPPFVCGAYYQLPLASIRDLTRNSTQEDIHAAEYAGDSQRNNLTLHQREGYGDVLIQLYAVVIASIKWILTCAYHPELHFAHVASDR